MCKHCENLHNHNNGGGSNFMSGLVWGALIGAALGVLYAPDSGDKTRKKLQKVSEDVKEKGQKLYDDAQVLAEDVKVAAKPLLEELERTVAPVLEKAMDSGKEVQQEVMEKIEQLVEDASDSKTVKKYFKNLK